MRNFRLVFSYELKNQLSKKVTRVTTIILMLIMLVGFSIPRIIATFESKGSASEQQPKGLIQNAGYVFTDEALLPIYQKALAIEEESLYQDRDSLVADLSEKNIEVGFVIKDETSFETIWQDKGMEDAQDQILAGVMRDRYVSKFLAEKNLSLEEVTTAQTFQPHQTNTILGKNSINSFMMAMLLMVFLYMIVLLYGNTTATIIAREKDSKTMELLITSCRPHSLILGKVAASGVAAVLQYGCVILATAVGYLINKEYLPQSLLFMLSGSLTQSYVISYVFYALIGYIMYLFLYAALGSTVSKVEDVGSATSLVQFLFIGGYIASSAIMNAPDSTIGVVLSMVPFTSLMLMPLRSALITVPLWQHLISGSLLILSTIFFAWLSIKIYRWGTLNYGNKKGVFHAIRMALRYKG